MKKLTYVIPFFFVMTILYLNSIYAATHTIGAAGQDFTTIQAANDDAGVVNGDTLLIVDAVLTEGDIVIDKSLVITGNIGGSTIQAAADSGTAPVRVMSIAPGVQVELWNLTIQHGVETDGGGIYNEGVLTLYGCTVQKNVATNSQPEGGGGIYNLNKLIILESDFVNNYSDGHGGGINNNDANSFLFIEYSTFTGNEASVGGGGIGSSTNDSIWINHCTFVNNDAGAKGGGLHIGGGSTDDLVYIGNSIFDGNESGLTGGGLNVYADSILMENLLIQNNEASNAGGGISIIGDAVMLQNSSIVNNTAGVKGGGIVVTYRAKVYVLNTTISDNYADDQGGGIANRGDLALEFTTVSNNSSMNEGGGIAYINQAANDNPNNKIYLRNTVIANNYDTTSMTHPSILDDSTRLVSGGNNFIDNIGNYPFVYNNSGDMYGDTADISMANPGALKYTEIIDAMLGDLEGGTDELKYRVPQPCSPLIDAASDTTAYGFTLTGDMLGDTRPFSDGNDIGAIEATVVSIDVTATISGVSSTGFTITLSEPVDGLEVSDFSLDNGGNITAAVTADGGNTYTITTEELTGGVLYTLEIADDCYDFAITGDDIVIVVDVAATVSGVTISGFIVALNPAVDGLDAGNFSLNHSGNITGATTSDNGSTYTITTDALTVNVTYTLSITETGYDFTVGGDDIVITESGIADSYSDNLKVYPNPASDVFYIQGIKNTGNITIEISDITGRLVHKYELQASKLIELNTSDIKDGLYFVKINNQNSTHIERLYIK